MKLLRRLFSRKYPFHSQSKQDSQKLTVFPLQFYSSGPQAADEGNVGFEPRRLNESQEEGVLQAYSLFLESLTSDNLESLDGLVEHNMLSRLHTSLAGFRAMPLQIRTIGSLEDAEVTHLGRCFCVGSVLPYRNLNFPSEYYHVKSLNLQGIQSVQYEVKSPFPVPKSFQEFGDLDLKSLNQHADLAEYRDRFLQLLGLLAKYRFTVMSDDIGILSSFKINVLDTDGTLIEGNSDPEAKEFHCLRIETVVESKDWLRSLLFWRSGFAEFCEKQFQGMAGEYTITDIDNYMHGNLIIPGTI